VGSPGSRGSPDEVLGSVFGFPGFRGLQEACVARVMSGGDALMLMPTGGGKSLCYQLPALCRPGMGLVISPLIALMDDQVAALRQLGIEAAALHSELDEEAQSAVRDKLFQSRIELLYVSPERLLAGTLLERLAQRSLSLVAIDEAHCVSAWGHEFRPEYRALATLRERLPDVPRIALTATADHRTRADILAALAMPDAVTFAASFHRPNLHLRVLAKEREMAQLGELLAVHQNSAGIVYCGSREKTERVAADLRGRGRNAVPFHARLSPIEKRAALGRFRAGEAMTIVATIAFGMGIDRPDVRFVAHLDMPDSPEGYYQQIGRAGRDGEPADTLLLYGSEDIARARYWLDQSQAPESQKRVMAERLEGMIGLCETAECRTATLLHCFGEPFEAPCGHCDNCRAPVGLFDGTVAAQKVLSAIYRTGQRFGAAHVVSVLRGGASEGIKRHGHDTLPTWGIGRDRSEQFWRGVIRALLARGALKRDPEHGGLAFAGPARALLRGEATLMLKAEEERRPIAAVGERAALPADAGMFERLRAWRSVEAKAQSVPPYVIFHDSVLREIADTKPADLGGLASIKGVGGSKLTRYGAALLGVLGEAPTAASRYPE
jgi:ATP-dependent DNA helicase RecQ